MYLLKTFIILTLFERLIELCNFIYFVYFSSFQVRLYLVFFSGISPQTNFTKSFQFGSVSNLSKIYLPVLEKWALLLSVLQP